METMDTQKSSRGYLMIFGAGCLWGMIGFFVKHLSALGADPGSIAFVRLFTAALILLGIFTVSGRLSCLRIDGQSLFFCALLGVLTQGMFNYFYNSAILSVGVATAAILLYISPVFVCIMSVMFFREHMGACKCAALFMNLLGCVMVVTDGDLSRLGASRIGILLGVGAAFTYSLCAIIGRVAADRLEPGAVAFYGLLFGSITMAVIARPWDTLPGVISVRFVIYAVGFGLISTVCAYLLYFSGISRVREISRVPVIASVEVLVSALVGMLVFSEKAGWIKITGVAVILLSIVLINVQWKGRRPGKRFGGAAGSAENLLLNGPDL